MPHVIPDLWPDDVAVSFVAAPLAILCYQASQLKLRTKGLLEAEVQTLKRGREKPLLGHSFDLIAPILNRYSYRLFTVEHDAEMVYPATVFAVDVGFSVDEFSSIPNSSAATQEEFLQLIGQILKANRVRSVLQSLIARSNESLGSLRPS